MAPLSKYQKVGIALALLCASEDLKIKRRKRWMNLWLKERLILSRSVDFEETGNLLRMGRETFYELLQVVRPLIEKKNTNMRLSVSAEDRLAVTLKFLATGREYRDLTHSTVISHQLLSQIIPETCLAIYKVLRKTIKLPSTEDEWETSARSFETLWQFNNCVGCLAGKHIMIQKPPERGSLYYNYEGKFSLILFAVINADYEFMYIHTGSHGSMSGEDLLKNTTFHEKLQAEDLSLLEYYLLPDTETSVPYVFLNTGTFALDTHIMRPFPKKNISRDQEIFNYRLHRASTVGENTFGVLAARFGVLQRQVILKLENVDAVVLACCSLHNYLRKKSNYLTASCVDREDVENSAYIKGSWRDVAHPMLPLQRTFQRPANDGKQVRDILTGYFNGVGSVPFQDRMADIVPN